MFASALWRDVDYRPLEQLEQTLLDSLSTNIARNRGIVALTRNLVDLIYEDYASLSRSYVIVGSLQQARKQALNILAHISGLRQDCGIDYGERHIEHTRYCTSYQRLARAGRTDHDDIALFNVYVIVILGLG